MSTVPEALAAHQCGMTVFAFSLITNECILSDDVEEGPTSEEVIESGESRDERSGILRMFQTSKIVLSLYPVQR